MPIIFAILLFLHADSNVASPTRKPRSNSIIYGLLFPSPFPFRYNRMGADESHEQTERNNLRIAVIVDQPGIVEADKFWQVAPGEPLVLALDRGGSTFDFRKTR